MKYILKPFSVILALFALCALCSCAGRAPEAESAASPSSNRQSASPFTAAESSTTKTPTTETPATETPTTETPTTTVRVPEETRTIEFCGKTNELRYLKSAAKGADGETLDYYTVTENDAPSGYIALTADGRIARADTKELHGTVLETLPFVKIDFSDDVRDAKEDCAEYAALFPAGLQKELCLERYDCASVKCFFEHSAGCLAYDMGWLVRFFFEQPAPDQNESLVFFVHASGAIQSVSLLDEHEAFKELIPDLFDDDLYPTILDKLCAVYGDAVCKDTQYSVGVEHLGDETLPVSTADRILLACKEDLADIDFPVLTALSNALKTTIEKGKTNGGRYLCEEMRLLKRIDDPQKRISAENVKTILEQTSDPDEACEKIALLQEYPDFVWGTDPLREEYYLNADATERIVIRTHQNRKAIVYLHDETDFESIKNSLSQLSPFVYQAPEMSFEELREQGKKDGGRYKFAEMLVSGRLKDPNKRVTAEEAASLMETYQRFDHAGIKICRLQNEPDFIRGDGPISSSYFLNSNGTDRLVFPTSSNPWGFSKFRYLHIETDPGKIVKALENL